MYSKVYNDTEIEIIPAPPRTSLEIFGGNLTVQEFRNNNNYFRKHQVYKPPLICESIIHSNKYTNSNIKNLKLKRSKPINKSNILNYINTGENN